MAKIQCMAKVTEVSVLAEGIVSMWLSASGVAKSAKPGQFISLYCDNSDTLLPRPISLCEVNQKDGLLRIVFRIVGAGTKEFAAKEKDDEIRHFSTINSCVPKNLSQSVYLTAPLTMPVLSQYAVSAVLFAACHQRCCLRSA